MKKWSNSLCKSSISTHLIEDIKNECGSSIPLALIETISTKIANKKDFKQLKAAINYLKDDISEELYTAIIEEQKEIKKDLQWIGTKRGKYVSALNDWHQTFHTEFRSINEFEDVLIGGHTERIVVFIFGKIKNEATLERLLEYINSKNPPYKLLVQVKFIQEK